MKYPNNRRIEATEPKKQNTSKQPPPITPTYLKIRLKYIKLNSITPNAVKKRIKYIRTQ
jgi:hypothetical protein